MLTFIWKEFLAHHSTLIQFEICWNGERMVLAMENHCPSNENHKTCVRWICNTNQTKRPNRLIELTSSCKSNVPVFFLQFHSCMYAYLLYGRPIMRTTGKLKQTDMKEQKRTERSNNINNKIIQPLLEKFQNTSPVRLYKNTKQEWQECCLNFFIMWQAMSVNQTTTTTPPSALIFMCICYNNILFEFFSVFQAALSQLAK